jgi:hypothetical protein
MSDNDKAWEIRTPDRLIATINHGDDGAIATQEFNNLMELLATRVSRYHGKHKGQFSIVIDLAADENGVDVTMHTKIKEPPRPVIRERMFLTDEGRLTMQDPARDTMMPGTDLGRASGRATG